MQVISVTPLKRGILKGDLTYFSSLPINPGDVVSVPLRGKKTLGLVTETRELSSLKGSIKEMSFDLKKVSENKGPSIWRSELLETIKEIAKYNVISSNNAIVSLIPNIFREEYDRLAKISDQGHNKKEARKNIKPEKLLFQSPKGERLPIYKTLIRGAFAKEESVFIVLPSQIDIENIKTDLEKGIERFTYILHSGLSEKKIIEIYREIMNSVHPVLILGTAPYLSIPKMNIGTIILEHESSSAYRTIKRPLIDLRTFVETYASKIHAKLIISDELLRFETIARQDMSILNTLYPLSYRIDFGGQIEFLKREKNNERGKVREFKILEDLALEDITNTLANKKNVFVFSLRKGLATLTMCRDCGNTLSCRECGNTMVLYVSKDGKKRMFTCNSCGEEKDPETRCEECNSWNLIPLGIGTDTVYEALKEKFPKTKIYKLDKESAVSAKGALKIANDFEEENGAILVGTEMALIYLKNKTPLSVVASFDSLFGIPSFKMSEKIVRLVMSILDKTQYKLIVQTKNTEDETIKAIEKGNILSFVRSTIEDRKTLGYPPFKRFIKISNTGEKIYVPKIKEFLQKHLAAYNPDIYSSFTPKDKGKYTTNALIKFDAKSWSLPSIISGSNINESLERILNTLPKEFEIQVDGEEII